MGFPAASVKYSNVRSRRDPCALTEGICSALAVVVGTEVLVVVAVVVVNSLTILMLSGRSGSLILQDAASSAVDSPILFPKPGIFHGLPDGLPTLYQDPQPDP